MADRSIKVPQPSITNYPDGEFVPNLDGIAFDGSGIRYKVPEGSEPSASDFDFMQAWMSHSEPIPTKLVPIKWNYAFMVQGNGDKIRVHDLSQNVFTQFHLMPGYLYQCIADLGVSSIDPDTSGNVALDYGWFTDSGQWIRSVYGSLRNNTADSHHTEISAIPLIAYISVTEADDPFIMELKVVSASSNNEILKENSHFNIEVKAKL